MSDSGLGRARILSYRFDTTITFDAPVSEHALVLRCQPRAGEGVTVLDGSVRIDPECRLSSQRDGFGNELLVALIHGPHDHVRYSSSGMVHVDLSHQRSYEAHPLYRYGGPLASADESMAKWLEGEGFAGDADGRDARSSRELCLELMHAVNGRLAYEQGKTTTETTAVEAWSSCRGVCQDYAHVMIALARQMGLAARYVTGLVPGEGSTHAWAQVYVGGVWQGFDPTWDVAVDETYLPLAVGRDWSDCPIERGVFRGVVSQEQQVQAVVSEMGAWDRP